jgi:hypothetical protein
MIAELDARLRQRAEQADIVTELGSGNLQVVQVGFRHDMTLHGVAHRIQEE